MFYALVKDGRLSNLAFFALERAEEDAAMLASLYSTIDIYCFETWTGKERIEDGKLVTPAERVIR